MKRTLSIVGLVILVVGRPTAQAGPEKPAPSLDFDSFRMITERNIFDPNRSPQGRPRSRHQGSSRRAGAEFFCLVGTLISERGAFAFFDGSSSQYRAVLEASNNIAGYTIARIAPNQVSLETTNGDAVQLPVGMQMSKHPDGWILASRSESFVPGAGDAGDADGPTSQPGQRVDSDAAADPAEAPGARAASDRGTQTAAKPDPGSSGAADVLKRLMQRREQELNK